MGWLGDILSALYVDEENAERGREADSRNRELNEQLYRDGDWTEQQWLESEARYDGQPVAEVELEEAFKDGAAQGYDDMTGGVKSALNAPARFLWDSLPWWLILLAILAALHYLGLLAPLMGRIRRAAA